MSDELDELLNEDISNETITNTDNNNEIITTDNNNENTSTEVVNNEDSSVEIAPEPPINTNNILLGANNDNEEDNKEDEKVEDYIKTLPKLNIKDKDSVWHYPFKSGRDTSSSFVPGEGCYRKITIEDFGPWFNEDDVIDEYVKI